MIVIDASVLANVVGDDGSDGQRARAEFRGVGDVAAPDLVDVETVAVLRKRWLAGTVTDQRFAAAVEDLGQLDLDRYPVLRFMRRADELRAKVPVAAGAHVGLLGAFAIAAFEKAPGIVYMESPDVGHTTEKSSVVAKVSETFDMLRAEALPVGPHET